MTPEPPAGVRCFLDANIFVYYFTRNPLFSEMCWNFVRRVQTGEIVACTSPMMISEALHRIMLSEVQVRFGVPKPLSYVQKHPQIISQLSNFQAAAAAFSGLNIEVLHFDSNMWSTLAAIASQYSLLTDDALTVALMQLNNIEYLATNDDDFDAIPRITACKPR